MKIAEVDLLKESTYQTPCGTIHYWSSILSLDTTTLVFLPGLTADHRLFDKQVAYFDGKYNIIVWDAPAHLQRNYVTAVEIWLLKRMEPVYAHYPWKLLLKSGTKGVATSNYGRNLMKEMMLVYDGDQHRYAQIAGHGFRILAEAMEKDLPYEIKCPSLLICGTKDHAGSCIRYNREWHRKTKIPLKWIEGAGHNSNTDKPEMINSLLEEFFSNIL